MVIHFPDVHKLQENVSVQVPETPLEVEPGLITTFMADYRPNWNVKKRTLCKPEETNYRKLVTPFDGTTTQSAEYKAWPVSKPEVPTWAKKPEYKPPIEGMALNSTYSVSVHLMSQPCSIHKDGTFCIPKLNFFENSKEFYLSMRTIVMACFSKITIVCM